MRADLVGGAGRRDRQQVWPDCLWEGARLVELRSGKSISRSLFGGLLMWRRHANARSFCLRPFGEPQKMKLAETMPLDDSLRRSSWFPTRLG